MISKIARWTDKFRSGNELTQWGQGKWYVRYPGGKCSCTMYYRAAQNYREIFGGQVFHVDDKR
jgi:hypothetical protein